MTITFINYADKAFKRHQHFSLKMATKRGKFDKVIGYSKVDIEPEFYEKNRIILDYDKGGGYWLWKPYFILKTLYNLSENDYLFYSDAGAFFLQSVGPLISEIAKSDQDIMGYELPFIERQWTKKELFINMNCDKKQYYNTNQIGSSFILIRKTPFSVTFFQNFLSFACIAKNITDIHKDNIYQESDFIEHRHDQSFFSIMAKIEGIPTISASEYWYPRVDGLQPDWDALSNFPIHAKRDKEFNYFSKLLIKLRKIWKKLNYRIFGI